MLLADILLAKSEWDGAIYIFEQMLSKAPANYTAIAKLIQLLRRAGRLEEAALVLKAAEQSSARASLEPGFRYCHAALARYQNDPRSALRHLNMARRDGEWGESALTAMIEIYLNPENETNWDELNIDLHVEPSEAVRAADQLLRELAPSPRREVLSCYTLMAYKGRSQIDKAASVLIELLAVEKDYVPALVCLSQAYLMLKQAPKARNHLKRVAKIPFATELVDDFERGWLMLADVYINGGKYDLAEELCWRCLASNKSCAKAWEFLGVVKEREMSYKDAAAHYEKAWFYENEASAAVGYKLSFNYLKAKKYVEAIGVCHKVLTQYPDYPKINSDVLEKAREALKP
jgi:tetratricopeptide repeat protein 21B